ncbi:MAG: motility protein A [Lachnospiraceae bacterium]
MDLASLIGLVAGVVMVIFGIVTNSDFSMEFGKLGNFVDIPSIIITIGGTMTCLIGSNSIKEFVSGFKGFTLAIKVPKFEPAETIRQIIDLSNTARKEGLLALEEAAANLEDPFMKKGVLLIVDGTDPDLLRAILETELVCIEDRHKKVIGFWSTMVDMAPAWGMIGTLIGLVNMLKNLSDFNSIGPNMAVALLTTLYGSLIANWLGNPIVNKLTGNNAKEIMLKEVMVEGLLSIQAGENPRVIEEKLKSFLAPSQRENINAIEGGEQ